jgi:hypothetical protein
MCTYDVQAAAGLHKRGGMDRMARRRCANARTARMDGSMRHRGRERGRGGRPLTCVKEVGSDDGPLAPSLFSGFRPGSGTGRAERRHVRPAEAAFPARTSVTVS